MDFEHQQDIERISHWAINRWLPADMQEYREDFVQELLVGLWEASLKFDPRLASMGTWLVKNSKYIILRLVTHHTGPKRNFRLEVKPTPYDADDDSDFIESTIPSSGDFTHHILASHDLNYILSCLYSRERKIVTGRFLEGRTLKEVGKELSLTRERVRQIQESALSVMKDVSELPRKYYRGSYTRYMMKKGWKGYPKGLSPKCHPDRKNYALMLCSSCWQKEHRLKSLEKYRKKERDYARSEKGQASQKNWRDKNPEHARERVKKWKKENPDKVKEMRKKHYRWEDTKATCNKLTHPPVPCKYYNQAHCQPSVA